MPGGYSVQQAKADHLDLHLGSSNWGQSGNSKWSDGSVWGWRFLRRNEFKDAIFGNAGIRPPANDSQRILRCFGGRGR